MTLKLTEDERKSLKIKHRTEHDGRIRDRIKSVILSDEGWTQKLISQALLIDEDTVGRHIRDYEELKKLKPQNGGSNSSLSTDQTKTLIEHLTEYTYTTLQEISAYVYKTYGVSYTRQGMHKWLERHEFSYKQPKGVPSKACPEAQEKFIIEYEELLKVSLSKDTPEEEPILFIDSVHPTMTTKISHGWIKIGHDNDKTILTTGDKSRVNLTGAINLESMEIFTQDYITIDKDATCEFFKFLKKHHPKAKKIHIILDNGPAHNNPKVKNLAKEIGIVLHFLPTYSPNLNPIERVWKIMNEHIRNNVFFKKSKDFVKAIKGFFKEIWPTNSHKYVDRVNDNFERINFSNPLKLFKPAPSS